MSVWVMPSVDVYENFLKRSQAIAGVGTPPCLRPLITKYNGGVSSPGVNHAKDNLFFLVVLVHQLSH